MDLKEFLSPSKLKLCLFVVLLIAGFLIGQVVYGPSSMLFFKPVRYAGMPYVETVVYQMSFFPLPFELEVGKSYPGGNAIISGTSLKLLTDLIFWYFISCRAVYYWRNRKTYRKNKGGSAHQCRLPE